MNLDELEKASLDFEKVLKLEPNNKETKNHLKTLGILNIQKKLILDETNKEAAKNQLKTLQNQNLPNKPPLQFIESVPNFYKEYVKKYGMNPIHDNDYELFESFFTYSSRSSKTLNEMVEETNEVCREEGD